VRLELGRERSRPMEKFLDLISETSRISRAVLELVRQEDVGLDVAFGRVASGSNADLELVRADVEPPDCGSLKEEA
jgi:hypothetical protein